MPIIHNVHPCDRCKICGDTTCPIAGSALHYALRDFANVLMVGHTVLGISFTELANPHQTLILFCFTVILQPAIGFVLAVIRDVRSLGYSSREVRQPKRPSNILYGMFCSFALMICLIGKMFPFLQPMYQHAILFPVWMVHVMLFSRRYLEGIEPDAAIHALMKYIFTENVKDEIFRRMAAINF